MKNILIMENSKINLLSYTCFLGMISFLITAILSSYFNPWFNFFKNAFSDLGSPNANMPWIYNYGLIITAIFIMLYSSYIIAKSKNKLEIVSGSFFFIAGIFLVLIGYLHEGMPYHGFVSVYFFTQSDFAILAWSLGVLRRNIKLGITFLLIGLIAPLISVILPWPSAATVEAFGIIIISIWAIVTFFYYRK